MKNKLFNLYKAARDLIDEPKEYQEYNFSRLKNALIALECREDCDDHFYDENELWNEIRIDIS